jgi:plastocyanin
MNNLSSLSRRTLTGLGVCLGATALFANASAPSPGSNVELNATSSIADPVADLGAASGAPATLGGDVSGRVVFDGEKPTLKPLDIPAEKAKGCSKDDSPIDNTDQSILISKDGGIRNVVVSIDVPDAKVVVPEKPIALNQATCHFDPHVTVVPVGATVDFLNGDSVGHNVHTFADKNESFNQTIAAGSKHTQKLDKPDRIEIKCDIHPWMNAWLVVSDTPYVAVTDADGKFTISGLKPGEYKVKYWHEKLGKGDGKLTVKEDGTCDALELKLGEKKKGGRRP